MAQWEWRKINLGLVSLALANPPIGVRAAMATDKIKPDASSALIVVEDACRGIDAGGALAKTWAGMNKASRKKLQSNDLAAG
jgi:hypothetical protein